MTMLRSILVALGAAACLFAFAALGEVPGGAVARAIVGVALGIGVTALIYGQATFVTVAVGAASPLAFAAIDPLSHGVAATTLCLLWLVPRFVLAGTRRQLFAVAGFSLVAAGIAGSIFASYADAPLAAHAASCVFAGSCLSLVGIVVPLPTTIAYALRTTAAVMEGPVREELLRAAHAHESSRWEPRTSAARKKWETLARLSDRRATLERAIGAEVAEQRRDIDERIQAIVRELSPLVSATKASPDDETDGDGELEIRVEDPTEDAGEPRTMPPTQV
jgi:hypothetical protein